MHGLSCRTTENFHKDSELVKLPCCLVLESQQKCVFIHVCRQRLDTLSNCCDIISKTIRDKKMFRILSHSLRYALTLRFQREVPTLKYTLCL